MRNRKKVAEDRSGVQLLTGRMRNAMAVCHFSLNRRFLVPLMVLGLISIGFLKLPLFSTNPKPVMILVDPSHRERVHSYVRSVLARECRPSFTRKKMEALYPTSSPVYEPFLQKNSNLTEQMFKYPPPFGFLDMQHKLKGVLNVMPVSTSEKIGGHGCRRCVVVGNGGILRGLELGPLLNNFNVILRLNSGPVRDFSRDVGNRTTIRMSYPEGSPKHWEDVDPQLQFVAVMYKSVDFNWLHAVITRTRVKRPCRFQHDNAKPHTAFITTAWLFRKRVRVVNWPVCSPDLSSIENIWCIIKRKIRQRRSRTVEQLESYIRQEWDNIPLPKLQQLVSSLPRHLLLLTVVKRRMDATQW